MADEKEKQSYKAKIKCCNCDKVYPDLVDIPFGVSIEEWVSGGNFRTGTRAACAYCGVFNVVLIGTQH